MTVEMLFIMIFLLMIIFLAFGMYIHSILLACGIIGILMLDGLSGIVGFLQFDAFKRVASYSLSTIPMYILMAQFIVRAGIVEDLYNFVYNLSRGKSSILGVLTIIAGGMLGAVSGSSNASAAAMAQVSVPQLLKRGYSPGIAGATVAAAGSLSSVIPPSIVLILWGVATETPIGHLFIGTLIPGVIMMIIMSICLLFFLKFSNKKNSGEVSVVEFVKEELSIKKTVISLSLTLFILLAVFVGIYAGIFTPTEAGAVGAFVSFIVALILRKVNIRFMVDSFADTVRITAMMLMIMIGAQIFGRFVSLSLLPRKIIELLSGLIEYPALILIILAVLYFVLFMLIEGAAVIVMTAPILLPLIIEIGVDKLWFGVFVGILCTIGLLTPPVGMSVYSVAGVTGISSDKIFKYALQFAIVLSVVTIVLLIIFPGLVTWLPSRM